MRVLLGYDHRERLPYDVAEASIRLNTSSRVVQIDKLDVCALAQGGYYTRPTDRIDGRLFDVISQAPMSTEHANARFWTPMLCDWQGWALFADSDILVRGDIADLFAHADPRFAVQVVQHQYEPSEAVKMDGQVQTSYNRKNWSSVILWNCAHPAHRILRFGSVLNRWPGRDLHAFKWLADHEIGELPLTWNWLVGVSHHPTIDVSTHMDSVPVTIPYGPPVQLAHFTLGTPDMPGYADQPFADEWWRVAELSQLGPGPRMGARILL